MTKLERLERFIRDYECVDDNLKHLTEDTYYYYKNELRKEEDNETRTYAEYEYESSAV